jgi:hypothetical protein
MAHRTHRTGDGSAEGTYGNNQGYDIPLKLFPGFHTFIGMDAYGDGWNGGTYSIAQNFGAGNVVVPVTAFGPSSPAEGQLGGPPAFPGGQLGRTSLYTFETTGCSNLAIAAESAPPVALVNEAKEEPTLEGATAGAPTAPCGGAGGPTTAQLTVHVENWSSDITWNVDGSTADGMHDGPLNYNQHDYVYSLTLDEGAHILNMNDEMGDTWNVMDGSTIQGSATITKMDGTVLVPPTLMANGVNSMPIPFALAGATPCPIDTPALGGVATILPACMTGCAGANDVTENTLGAKCHFIGGFTLEEDCFATCNFGADGDAGGLQSACDALNSVDMAVATPETLAVLSDSINSGSYTTISTTAAVISEGSFASIDELNAAIDTANVGGTGSEVELELTPEPSQAPTAGGSGSGSEVELEETPVASGSGSGSGSDYTAPTFDDDWFFTPDDALLMSSKSTAVSSQTTSKSAVSVVSTAALSLSSAAVALSLSSAAALMRPWKVPLLRTVLH